MGDARVSEMSDALYARVESVIAPGEEIETLANKQINRIAGLDRTVRSG